MRRRQLNLLLICGLGVALLLGVLAGHLNRAPERVELENGLLLNTPRPVPDFQLVDEQGREFGLAELRGRWQLMFFGFTHCPDICPTTMGLMRQVYTGLPETARAGLEVRLVSVDPERDTPENLARYVRHFHPDFGGLTGETEQLEAFASALGAAFVRVPQDETYTMDHTTALVLTNPAGELVAFFPAPHRREALVADLERILDRS